MIEKIIKIGENERIMVQIEADIDPKKIKILIEKLEEFFKDKTKKFIVYGGFKIVKI